MLFVQCMQFAGEEYNLLHVLVYVTIIYIQLRIMWPCIVETTLTFFFIWFLHHCFKCFQDNKWWQLVIIKIYLKRYRPKGSLLKIELFLWFLYQWNWRTIFFITVCPLFVGYSIQNVFPDFFCYGFGKWLEAYHVAL